MAKEHRKWGGCSECGQPRALHECAELNRWFCQKCLRKVCPPKPPLLASENQRALLGKLGLASLYHDRMTNREIRWLINACLENSFSYYVLDVYMTLAGKRPGQRISWEEIRRVGSVVASRDFETASAMIESQAQCYFKRGELAAATGQDFRDVVVPMEPTEVYLHACEVIRREWAFDAALDNPF